MKTTDEIQTSERLIFLYGSLKRGFPLHHYLASQQFIGLAETLPLYRLFDCGEYPALVAALTKGKRVRGEVYRLSEACQLQLDDVEDVSDGLYERREIRLAAPFDTQNIEAYFYLHSVARLRDCGARWP
mgnify:CR=1 FL=1